MLSYDELNEGFRSFVGRFIKETKLSEAIIRSEVQNFKSNKRFKENDIASIEENLRIFASIVFCAEHIIKKLYINRDEGDSLEFKYAVYNLFFEKKNSLENLIDASSPIFVEFEKLDSHFKTLILLTECMERITGLVPNRE